MTATTTEPAFRCLSLGAGVQSSLLLILAAQGHLPKIQFALFSDTGWEPKSVYTHLDRLEREVAAPAGIKVFRVSSGNIRRDALDPDHRFSSMPLFIKNPDGGNGMTRRQCTGEYKIKPLQAKVRELLGYPYPARIPAGVFVEQWIGISRDEFHRAKDADVRYMRNRFPLLDLDLTREDCLRLLAENGFPDTPKSSCLGCPVHSDRQWRQIRDQSPEEWADVVSFDAAIRAGSARANATGSPLLGSAYLHRSRLPVDQAPIDRLSRAERRGQQLDLLPLADADEDDEPGGCSPWACRGDAA